MGHGRSLTPRRKKMDGHKGGVRVEKENERMLQTHSVVLFESFEVGPAGCGGTMSILGRPGMLPNVLTKRGVIPHNKEASGPGCQ